MDDRSVNIDLVFRNGLKDYEVLPPADIWDNIMPVIEKKQRPYIILRSAAIIAVALSLSFLAYRWGQEASSGKQEMMQVQNTRTTVNPSSADDISPPGNANLQILLTDATGASYRPDIISTAGDDFVIQSVGNPSVSDALPSSNTAADNYELQSVSSPAISSIESSSNVQELVTGYTESDKSGKWSMTAMVSPSYHNRISKGNNETMAQMMTSEKPVISYSGGLALSYRINRRFSVQSGLYYSNIGQELSGISAYSGFLQYSSAKSGSNFDVVTASGTVKTSNSDVFLQDKFKGERVITQYTSNVIDPVKSELNYIDNSLRQNFSYLELPVYIRYKLIDKTLDLNLVGGLSSNLLVRNTVSAGNGKKTQIGETVGLNNFTFSSSFGMGMEYNFSDKLSLNLEPTFRYYLNPFGSIPGMKIHPVSFGVFSGLSYRF